MATLAGKAAIVIGATNAIGEATAQRFLSEGAEVMLVGPSSEKLAAVRDRLPFGRRMEMSVAKAVDDGGMGAAVAAAIKAFGGVDILFANVGISARVAQIEAISVLNSSRLSTRMSLGFGSR